MIDDSKFDEWMSKEAEFRLEEVTATRRNDHAGAATAHRARIRCLDEARKLLEESRA